MIEQLILIFAWVVGASLKTLPLILLMLLLQRYGKKFVSASSLHILWLLVLLSLSLPVGWQVSPFGNFSSHTSDQSDGLVVANTVLPDDAALITESPKNEGTVIVNNLAPEQSVLNIPLVLCFIWLSGIGLCLSVIAHQYWRYSRIKSQAVAASDEYQSQLSKLKSRVGVRQNVSLLFSEHLESPVTFGYVRPAILLPNKTLENLDPERIEHIFLHELMHIKRRDIAFCWLASLVTILHWFNPAAWFALNRMRKNIEIACDAEALKHLQEKQRAGYGETLISLADKSLYSQHGGLAVGILENHTDLKERITMISQFHKNGIKSRLFIIFMAGLFALTAVAQPSLDKKSEDKIVHNDPNAIELGKFVRKAEKDLKQTILVGEAYANNKIQVSKDLGKIDYGKLLSVLRVNDFTAFRTNDLIKVIPVKDARNSAIPVVEANGKYYEDEYVTEYIPLSKACANKLLPVIRPMIPQHSHMAFNHPRSLIINDTYGNIQRIKKVIEKIESGLDKPEDCNSSTPN